MTETDATRRPLTMPEIFVPYMERHRVYKLFKDMMQDLIINLPKDHVKHMKIFLNNRVQSIRDVNNIMIITSPDLKIDVDTLVKALMKDFGFTVITRRYVLDQYEKHDDFVPGCLSPELLAKVTKNITTRYPAPVLGWLMFDHPRTFREARCLQQEGVLPTVTLLLTTKHHNKQPPEQFSRPIIRNMFKQDFEGLKFAYKATAKVVLTNSREDPSAVLAKCFHAIRACISGAQSQGQGLHVVGAPGVYRVLIVGPRGSGSHTQARITAKHFGLVLLNFNTLYAEAYQNQDDIGIKLRRGVSCQLKSEVLKRRLLRRDCLDHGWVLIGYPITVNEFEYLDLFCTPPNRVLFLNTPWETCKARLTGRGVDLCSGAKGAAADPEMDTDPRDEEDIVENELELYFTETHPELRTAAGITAVDIDGGGTIDQVQTRIQAAIMAAPMFNMGRADKQKLEVAT